MSKILKLLILIGGNVMSISNVPLAQAAAPYSPSTVISGITLDWSTHLRAAPGSDNFQLNWATDDNLYGTWGDGGDFADDNSIGRVSLGVARISGSGSSWSGHDVWGASDSFNTVQGHFTVYSATTNQSPAVVRKLPMLR